MTSSPVPSPQDDVDVAGCMKPLAGAHDQRQFADQVDLDQESINTALQFAEKRRRELRRDGLEPEDFASIAATKFWMAKKSSEEFPSYQNFLAFMWRVSRNARVDTFRRARSGSRRLVRHGNEMGQDFEFAEMVDSAELDPAKVCEGQEGVQQVTAYLGECGRDGEWFTLKYIQGCRYQDIATSYGVSLTAVKEFFRKKSARCNAIKLKVAAILAA